MSAIKRLYFKGSLEDRFWNRVEKTDDGCWLWNGSRTERGYGRIGGSDKKVLLAHRLSWKIHFGEPRGLCVLHRCDNPPCVNPDHLFLGTVLENNEDMREKGRGTRPPYHSGESHPRAKLTLEEVLQIRSSYSPRKVTRSQLADRFGVSEGTIKAILSRRNWNGA